VVIAVAVLAIVASAGGLLISTRIKSPAQLAAQTAPPASTQLTVPVTRQVITSTVLAQAVVKAPPEVAQLSGANNGGGGNGVLPVVTKIFFPKGSTPVPGSVIVEVAGPAVRLPGHRARLPQPQRGRVGHRRGPAPGGPAEPRLLDRR